MTIALFLVGATCTVIGYVIGLRGCTSMYDQLRDDLESRRQTIVDFSSQIDSQANAMTIQHELIKDLERENEQLRQVGREVAKFADQQFPDTPDDAS